MTLKFPFDISTYLQLVTIFTFMLYIAFCNIFLFEYL